MPKTRQQKEAIVAQLDSELSDMKSAVVVGYAALSVSDTETLRAQLREKGAKITMVKRSLLKRVLDARGITDLDIDALPGSLALATSKVDEVAPAHAVYAFAKDREEISLLRGVLVEGDSVTVMDETQVTRLAQIPSREELLAKAVGSLNAPISGFVNVLAGNVRSLVNVLNAIKESK